MGDFTVTCNGCRSGLGSWALVTQCSHIFCGRCNASEAIHREKQCTICGGRLQTEYSIVQKPLELSEDERATMLHGLSPTTIMDICWRSIEFWNYQGEQERRYQAATMEVLQNNYNQLSYAHQRNIEIANNKMRELGERVKSLASTERELRQQADKSREEMKKMELKLFQTQAASERRRHSSHLTNMVARGTDRTSTLNLTGQDRPLQFPRPVPGSGDPSPGTTTGGPPPKRYRVGGPPVVQGTASTGDDPAYRPAAAFSRQPGGQGPEGFEGRGDGGGPGVFGAPRGFDGRRSDAIPPQFADAPSGIPGHGNSQRPREGNGGDRFDYEGSWMV